MADSPVDLVNKIKNICKCFIITGPVSLLSVFFTASLTAAIVDLGMTIDSELCGLANAVFAR